MMTEMTTYETTSDEEKIKPPKKPKEKETLRKLF